MTDLELPTCYDRGKLETLTELGKGGQGRVWAVRDDIRINKEWVVAYKEYDVGVLSGLNVDQLRRMVAFVPSLPAETGRWLCEQTAWPALVVCEASRVRGFLMRRIPPDFELHLPPQNGISRIKPAGLQFLLNPDDYLDKIKVSVDDRRRLLLLAALAETLDRLHQLAIVVGDLSPNNLLFQFGVEPRCFFIDCDAMRLSGCSVLRQTETPDWEVPAGEELATTRSDAYKFGLLAIRLFARDQISRDPDVLAPVSAELAGLARRSLSKDPWARPGPAEWLPELRAAVMRCDADPPMSGSHRVFLTPASKPANAGDKKSEGFSRPKSAARRHSPTRMSGRYGMFLPWWCLWHC